jgi:hypothetical protein
MQFLVNVPDKKAKLMREILESISFASVVPLTKGKGQRIMNLVEAIAELNEIKAGRRKAIPLKEALDAIRG